MKKFLFKLNLQIFAEEEPEDKSLADAYKILKDNSVPKEEYEKLKREHQEVIEKIINGTTETNEDVITETEDELRKALYSEDSNLTNLDYVKKTLSLRKIVMSEGRPDPFLPFGNNVIVTEEDIEQANKVAEYFQHCVDECGGDPVVFRALLQKDLVDVVPIKKGNRAR